MKVSAKKVSDQSIPSHDRKDKPTLVVIGNSHLTHIDTSRLVPKTKVKLLPAFTINEAASQLDYSLATYSPRCVVIHEITNDVKSGHNA